jgi:hypothetical protein
MRRPNAILEFPLQPEGDEFDCTRFAAQGEVESDALACRLLERDTPAELLGGGLVRGGKLRLER